MIDERNSAERVHRASLGPMPHDEEHSSVCARRDDIRGASVALLHVEVFAAQTLSAQDNRFQPLPPAEDRTVARASRSTSIAVSIGR